MWYSPKDRVPFPSKNSFRFFARQLEFLEQVFFEPFYSYGKVDNFLQPFQMFHRSFGGTGLSVLFGFEVPYLLLKIDDKTVMQLLKKNILVRGNCPDESYWVFHGGIVVYYCAGMSTFTMLVIW